MWLETHKLHFVFSIKITSFLSIIFIKDGFSFQKYSYTLLTYFFPHDKFRLSWFYLIYMFILSVKMKKT